MPAYLPVPPASSQRPPPPPPASRSPALRRDTRNSVSPERSAIVQGASRSTPASVVLGVENTCGDVVETFAEWRAAGLENRAGSLDSAACEGDVGMVDAGVVVGEAREQAEAAALLGKRGTGSEREAQRDESGECERSCPHRLTIARGGGKAETVKRSLGIVSRARAKTPSL